LQPAEREKALGQLLILAGLRRFEAAAAAAVCHLRRKLAARESIMCPALRQNPFDLNSAVPSPTVKF